MKNKIALEEHFATDLTIDQSKLYSKPVVWEMLKANLLDIEQQRLDRMEKGGTSFSILSLNSPGIQGIPNVKEAIDVSRRVRRLPRRRRGVAARLTRHVAHHCTGFKRRRDNRLLLLDAPPATPLGTSQYLDACHRTVSCTGANTGVCIGTYQPDQLTDRKTVLGGGLPSNLRFKFAQSSIVLK